jgi:hypothetical protein
MATARAIFQCHIDGLLPESQLIDAQWTITNAIGAISRVTLANGDNTITVPAGTTLIIMIPPVTSNFSKVQKGAGGDTGTGIQRTFPEVFPYASGNFIVNSAGLETLPTTFIFL